MLGLVAPCSHLGLERSKVLLQLMLERGQRHLQGGQQEHRACCNKRGRSSAASEAGKEPFPHSRSASGQRRTPQAQSRPRESARGSARWENGRSTEDLMGLCWVPHLLLLLRAGAQPQMQPAELPSAQLTISWA